MSQARGRSIGLSDAFASFEVELRDRTLVSPGDLLVVEGLFQKKRIRDARITLHDPAPLPRGDGEIARFSHTGVAPRLEARARAFETIRRYFRAQRFIEVDTPARVRTPGLDLHVDALPQEKGFPVTSPEFFMKRMLVGGMPRIYQLSHCFRADEHGSLHEPEFTLLEWYRAFAGAESVRRDTEAVVIAVMKALGGPALRRPFERISVRDAFRRHAAIDDAVALAASDPDRDFELLVERVEPALAEVRRPVFLVDYPITEASLARPSPGDPSVAERFELYVDGIELSNGFGELTDPVEQRRRFRRDQRDRKRLGRPRYPLDERFLGALEEGMPPSAGNALGVDRLIALALGRSEIADVIGFPEGWR